MACIACFLATPSLPSEIYGSTMGSFNGSDLTNRKFFHCLKTVLHLRVFSRRDRVARTRTSCTCILYGMHAERWHAVRNACQKTACCMECMLKDGMLYRMQAKGLHSVQNAKFYCAEGVKLNSPLMVDLLWKFQGQYIINDLTKNYEKFTTCRPHIYL